MNQYYAHYRIFYSFSCDGNIFNCFKANFEEKCLHFFLIKIIEHWTKGEGKYQSIGKIKASCEVDI